MAFNLQTFKTRAITSVVFVVVMLAGIFINQWTFLALFTIIHFGCWVEYQKMVALIDPAYATINKVHKYAVMLAGWGFMLWMTSSSIYNIEGFVLFAVGKWLCISMLVIAVISAFFNKPFNPKFLAHSFFGLLYISLSFGLLVNIRGGYVLFGTQFGEALIIILIASIWINDTMAYIVGSFIGKTQMSRISPKKTWEGTIGGALLAITVITLICYIKTDDGGIVLPVSLFVLIATVAGTLGDLLESKLKRMANVKDSGSIMPGHGGFLDRFDSLLLAIPFIWLYLQIR